MRNRMNGDLKNQLETLKYRLKVTWSFYTMRISDKINSRF